MKAFNNADCNWTAASTVFVLLGIAILGAVHLCEMV